MKDKLLEYREIALQVFGMLFISYIIILVYKSKNPYILPNIEVKFTYTLILLGIIVLISYFPYEKIRKSIKKLNSFELTTVIDDVSNHLPSLSTGQKFVSVAIILLIFAASILALGNEADANRVAIIAYYFLVLGVLNLLAEYLINPEDEQSDPHPEVRIAVSLILFGIAIYLTPEITKHYPYASPIFFVLLLLLLCSMLIKTKKREKRN